VLYYLVGLKDFPHPSILPCFTLSSTRAKMLM